MQKRRKKNILKKENTFNRTTLGKKTKTKCTIKLVQQKRIEKRHTAHRFIEKTKQINRTITSIKDRKDDQQVQD